MLETQLRHQLENVARRIGWLWMWRRLTWAWISLAVLLFVLTLSGRPITSAANLLGGTAAVAGYMWIRSRMLATPRDAVARRIEQAFPDLNSRLLAAIEQQPEAGTTHLNVLQRQVISEAVHHARMNDWSDAVPRRQMVRAFVGQAAAFALFFAAGALAMQVSAGSAAARSRNPVESVSAAAESPVTVEPGNAELERGSSLLVLARFTGKPPAEVDVVWKGLDQLEHRLSLTKSLDDPVFASRLPSIQEDIQYHVEFDGRQTEDYQITVYDLPALVRSDIQLSFPQYTQLPPKLRKDAFEVSAVERTQVEIICHVNKPLASARLRITDGPTMELHPDATEPNSYRLSFVPERRLRAKLELIDDAGRHNRDPEEFRIDVIPNRVPDFKVAFPGKDVKVSPLEEVNIETTVIDDFGVLETGVVVQIPGQEPLTVPLAQELTGGEQHKLSTIQRLEDLRVQPDDLVTYYLYADDYGPDGERRRTSGDVYFVEVRAFDEIYRQVDQEGAGEMQSSQKPPESLANLLQLQKQIIIATWKQLRQLNAPWSPKMHETIETIAESQSQAIKKLEAQREKLSQPQLQPTFSAIAADMAKAQQQLSEAIERETLQPLTPASVAEQAAYQGLLKLRAKEHLMMQSKSKGSGQQNEEKEKFDLELKRQQNRYESEKSAARREESNVNRESLAILDRLKELAQRQEGLNEQLKDLESQMRQAKTDSEKEELERRLKRLREEQQQLLHDSDELRNKLNQSGQPDAVAETRQQLEQTRQRMVETAEKLREGQLSQALNAGTRTERELKQMHDDFRRQTSAQFADSMRSLREEARQLAEREQQLSQQLAQLGDDSRRTLRQSTERAQLQEEFQQQQEQTNQVIDRAKQVVQEAETAEPLLSKQLYDTLRTTRESKLEQAQTATRQLLKQGILSEATKAEEQAQNAINQLTKGIEKAAESVLGNEVESLRRARKELAELSQQLEQEIQANKPDGQGTKPGQTAGGTQPGSKPTSPDGQPNGEGRASPSSGNNQEPGASNSSQPGTTPNAGEGKQPATPNAAPGQGQSPGQGSDPNGAPGQEQGQGSGQSAEGQGAGQQPQPGQGKGQGQGSGQGQGGEPSDSSNGSDAGSDNTVPTTAIAGEEGAPGRSGRASLRSSRPGGRTSPGSGKSQSTETDSNGSGSPGNSQGGGPLTGGHFTEFNERLRDVESMISDPKLQAEVQKVRDRARSARAEFKRHTQTPNWDLVRTSVHQPMLELQQRLAEEIARHETPDSLVPVDRDPVPTRYRDLVREYYERLATGKDAE